MSSVLPGGWKEHVADSQLLWPQCPSELCRQGKVACPPAAFPNPCPRGLGCGDAAWPQVILITSTLVWVEVTNLTVQTAQC